MIVQDLNPSTFEAVYYSYAIPRGPEVLTFLGLIFDKVYFPAVHMPPDGFDEDALIQEIQRIESLGLNRNPNDQQLVGCLKFALHHKHISDWCIFSKGRSPRLGDFEPQTHAVVGELEEMLFGPRPEGDIPISSGPWIKGLPGMNGSDDYISAPDTITYPANALVFAARKGLPLINDQHWLPVPGIPSNVKSNAKALAMILAIESVRLILPRLRSLGTGELREFRNEIAPDVKPFRVAMLQLAKQLNAAISTGSAISDIQQEARFIVETVVYPELEHLKSVLKNPGKNWYQRAGDLAKSGPELVSNFFTLPTNIALAKLLAKFTGILADVRQDQIERDDRVSRSGLGYLLKLDGGNVR